MIRKCVHLSKNDKDFSKEKILNDNLSINLNEELCGSCFESQLSQL